MKRASIAISLLLAAVAPAISTAAAEPAQRAPFTQSLSNNIPLAFGMSVAEAAAALGAPLEFISGLPGNEVLAARRPSPNYNNRDARLFLQFRNNRLSGWKGDWARNWMWE
jgi:hypothetical protein